MADEEKDEKEEGEETRSESSTEESLDEGQEPQEESTDEPEEESEEKSEDEPEEEPEDDLHEEDDAQSEVKEALAKKDEQIANLNKALAEERAGKRKITNPEPAKPDRESASPVTSDPVSKRLVEENESLAMRSLYKEYPQLKPENDPDNDLWDRFNRGYKVLVEIDGKLPVTTEGILEKGREVMATLAPQTTPPKVEEGDKVKAQQANLGKASSGKRKKELSISEADKKAASLAGMSVEEYAKYKDTYNPDEVPI